MTTARRSLLLAIMKFADGKNTSTGMATAFASSIMGACRRRPAMKAASRHSAADIPTECCLLIASPSSSEHTAP